MYVHFFKRLIDLILSLILLTLFSPIIIIFITLLLIINNGKPFFYQSRPGKDEKIFKLIKFKTMDDKCYQEGNLLPDKYRLTRVGKLIRKTSIDEILQLVNVLKGDMSIVGPRPLSVKYLPLYNDFQRKRHNVLPGITGLAQISGRNAISWKKRFEFDIYYVGNISFLLDIKIIFLTVFKVLRQENVQEGGQDMVESFKGFK